MPTRGHHPTQDIGMGLLVRGAGSRPGVLLACAERQELTVVALGALVQVVDAGRVVAVYRGKERVRRILITDDDLRAVLLDVTGCVYVLDVQGDYKAQEGSRVTRVHKRTEAHQGPRVFGKAVAFPNPVLSCPGARWMEYRGTTETWSVSGIDVQGQWFSTEYDTSWEEVSDAGVSVAPPMGCQWDAQCTHVSLVDDGEARLVPLDDGRVMRVSLDDGKMQEYGVLGGEDRLLGLFGSLVLSTRGTCIQNGVLNELNVRGELVTGASAGNGVVFVVGGRQRALYRVASGQGEAHAKKCHLTGVQGVCVSLQGGRVAVVMRERLYVWHEEALQLRGDRVSGRRAPTDQRVLLTRIGELSEERKGLVARSRALDAELDLVHGALEVFEHIGAHVHVQSEVEFVRGRAWVHTRWQCSDRMREADDARWRVLVVWAERCAVQVRLRDGACRLKASAETQAACHGTLRVFVCFLGEQKEPLVRECAQQHLVWSTTPRQDMGLESVMVLHDPILMYRLLHASSELEDAQAKVHLSLMRTLLGVDTIEAVDSAHGKMGVWKVRSESVWQRVALTQALWRLYAMAEAAVSSSGSSSSSSGTETAKQVRMGVLLSKVFVQEVGLQFGHMQALQGVLRKRKEAVEVLREQWMLGMEVLVTRAQNGDWIARHAVVDAMRGVREIREQCVALWTEWREEVIEHV